MISLLIIIHTLIIMVLTVYDIVYWIDTCVHMVPKTRLTPEPKSFLLITYMHAVTSYT